MTATVPSLADMLADAKLALHRLQIGQAAVEVTVAGGYTTKFTPANVDKLMAYVQQLQDQIAGVQTRGAIGFVF
jgi:gpW